MKYVVRANYLGKWFRYEFNLVQEFNFLIKVLEKCEVEYVVIKND